METFFLFAGLTDLLRVNLKTGVGSGSGFGKLRLGMRIGVGGGIAMVVERGVRLSWSSSLRRTCVLGKWGWNLLRCWGEEVPAVALPRRKGRLL